MKVVFDIGKVLIDARFRWSDILDASGVRYSPSAIDDQTLLALPTYLPYENGEITDEQYLQSLVDCFQLENLESARRVHASIIAEEFDGVEELIDELHANGVETAALSNNNSLLWDVLMTSPIYPGIQKIQRPYASFHLEASKPDPAIFEAFMQVTGWVPAEIVFFDDLTKNVEVARQFGWTAYQVTELPSVSQLRGFLGR